MHNRMRTTAILILLATGTVRCALADPGVHVQAPPWRQLDGVECPASNALCAAIGGRLYLLGGMRRSVRGDLVPSNELQEIDVAAGRSKTLAACPVGVWGAVLVADPNARRLLVLGGKERAGAPVANNTLKLAVYSIANAEWEVFEINSDRIGQPTRAFMHDNMVAILAANPAELVIVELEDRKVVTRIPCPEGVGLPWDGVLVGDAVFISGKKDRDLWRWKLGQQGWKKIGRLSASQSSHESVLFTNGRRLLSWSPREPGARIDTAVWEINQDTGGETMIHRAFPGPAARANSSLCVGDGKLYVCAGQASTGGWFQDIWVYDIAAGERLRDVHKLPDLKLEWAIDALADDRLTERWVWEILSQRRPSVIVDRLNELPDGPRRHLRWRLLCTLMGDLEADIAFVYSVPPQQLLKEVADIWPTEIEPVALDGAYHWTIRARSIAGPVVHDAVLLSIDGFGTDQAKLVHFETVRDRVYLFEQAPPHLGIYNCGVLNRGRIMYSADTGRGGTCDSRGYGHSIPKGMTLPVMNLEGHVDFSNNASIMPMEVERLVPAGY
jgi:hypothetical protein